MTLFGRVIRRPVSFFHESERRSRGTAPELESWYPSLFHAAEDLGIIRARVCSPSSLMLNNRHASVQSAGVNAFREIWGGNE